MSLSEELSIIDDLSKIKTNAKICSNTVFLKDVENRLCVFIHVDMFTIFIDSS